MSETFPDDSETFPDDSEAFPDDSALQRFEREKADSDGWKQHLRGNFYDEHTDCWETWGEITPRPRAKATIEELGAALRPIGEPVIDETLDISKPLPIQTRQLLRGLRAIKNEMLVNVVETGEHFRYSESRNLWIQILNK
jgi:hypothetical protein